MPRYFIRKGATVYVNSSNQLIEGPKDDNDPPVPLVLSEADGGMAPGHHLDPDPSDPVAVERCAWRDREVPQDPMLQFLQTTADGTPQSQATARALAASAGLLKEIMPELIAGVLEGLRKDPSKAEAVKALEAAAAA